MVQQETPGPMSRGGLGKANRVLATAGYPLEGEGRGQRLDELRNTLATLSQENERLRKLSKEIMLDHNEKVRD